MTHKQRVLELLRDGQPHSHKEGYALGAMLHSRVADLRRDGHEIKCWRDGDLSMYQLVSFAQPEPGIIQPPQEDHATGSGCASDGDLLLFEALEARGAYDEDAAA